MPEHISVSTSAPDYWGLDPDSAPIVRTASEAPPVPIEQYEQSVYGHWIQSDGDRPPIIEFYAPGGRHHISDDRIDQIVNIYCHEALHAILRQEVGPEASRRLDYIEHHDSFLHRGDDRFASSE